MSEFSLADFDSDEYRWRQETEKRVLVTICSQPSLAETTIEKITDNCLYDGYVDIDALHLKEFFKRFPVKAEVNFVQNIGYDDYLRENILVMNEKRAEYEKYDCFFFVFLTYNGKKSTDNEKLHFYSSCRPLEDVLNEVKKQEVTWGKPKIFLVQADHTDLPKEKGPTVMGEKKIPQDADILTIKSTIPQETANKNISAKEKKKPSFLVQAFVEAMNENKNEDRQDLLTLTTIINGKVAGMINESGNNGLSVPLVTSTFTKRLVFQTNS